MTDQHATALAFARRLAQIYGPSLVTALLYGSAARGDFRPGVSDLNVLIILRSLDLPQLRLATAAVADWAEQGNPPPLMLTQAEWRTSADVFPIEYSDIRESHILLVGTDPFVDLRIHQDHLRFRLEHELRSKKIQLREGFLAAGDSPEHVGALLLRSLPTFLTMFRAILRLIGTAVPADAAGIVLAVADKARFTPDAVLEVVRSRESPADFAPSPDGPVSAGYLDAIERTTQWLDTFPVGAIPTADRGSDPGAEV